MKNNLKRDSFTKLVVGSKEILSDFEAEIRADERKKVLAELEGRKEGRGKSTTSHGAVQALKPQMMELLNAGMSKPDIAKQLGVGRSTVYKILKEEQNSSLELNLSGGSDGDSKEL